MLYIVGTPIGNLGDISPRAAETLSSVDFIAAEDTRVTRRLLNHLGIRAALVSYHEHNRLESGQKILERLTGGESCALVADAGMPVISDPGHDLVALCHENGIRVAVVPGPSAAACAVALSGLACGRFCFEGFLTTAKRKRREHLISLEREERAMVFYEAPHKLASTLNDMLRHFGDRRIAIAREMTKLHEEVVRATLSEAAAKYAEIPPKGELVIVVEGAKIISEPAELPVERALLYVGQGMSVRDAARRASAETKCSRSELYRVLIASKDI